MMKCVHTSEDNETSCPVRSVDSIVIPSRHEAVIKSKVIPSTNMKEAILVPLMKFVNTHGLVVGQVLVNTENSEIYVRVFNPGDKKVFVKENTEIALVTCVDFFSDELPNSMMCNVETGIIFLNSLERCILKDVTILHQSKQRNLSSFYLVVKLRLPTPRCLYSDQMLENIESI